MAGENPELFRLLGVMVRTLKTISLCCTISVYCSLTHFTFQIVYTRQDQGEKIAQTIKERGNKLQRIVEIEMKTEITDADMDDMIKFG